MPPTSDDDGRHGLRHAGDDAFQLTVDYLKQETVEPLRGLGRYLYMGILASFLVAIGLLMILIGILRLLQKETGTALTGDWSWVPYAVVVFLGLVVIALAASRITAGPGRARMPEVEARQRADEAAAGEKAAAVTQPTTPTVRRVTQDTPPVIQALTPPETQEGTGTQEGTD